MNRAKIALLLLTGCAAAMGCRMCAHPYDCYGPTWLGCPGEPTWEFERAGSAFSGYGHAASGGVVIDGAEQLEAVPADPGQPAEQAPQGPLEPGLTPPPAGGAFPDGMTSAPHTRSALRQRH